MTEKHIHEELGDVHDQNLLDILRRGVPVIDNTGNPVLDEDGKAVMKPPPAAYFQVARARLRDLHIGKVPKPGDATDQLAEELGLSDDDTDLRQNILRMPDISNEPDAATA